MRIDSLRVMLRGVDIENDSLRFFISPDIGEGISNSGKLGNIKSVNRTSANITYTPNPHFYGNDAFEFKVNDGLLDRSKTGLASVIVNHVNHPPVRLKRLSISRWYMKIYGYKTEWKFEL